VIISLIIELIIICFDRKTVADLDAVGREKSQAFRLQPQKKERKKEKEMELVWHPKHIEIRVH
jgi:hypothetical protein